MSEDSKHFRYEQSDMIIVLLNLAVIPDKVIVQMDFFQGWQKRFKVLMDNYKKDFKGICPWKYQDQDLEDKYALFVKEKEKTDVDY